MEPSYPSNMKIKSRTIKRSAMIFLFSATSSTDGMQGFDLTQNINQRKTLKFN